VHDENHGALLIAGRPKTLAVGPRNQSPPEILFVVVQRTPRAVCAWEWKAHRWFAILRGSPERSKAVDQSHLSVGQ